MNQERDNTADDVKNECVNKVELRKFSKFMFDIIFEKKQINDAELMAQLNNQFGPVKEQTLNRRKYDTVNILEKADIIITLKNKGSSVYQIKHEVPNSVKDLEATREKKQKIQKRIQQKRDKIRMMKMGKSNHEKLIGLSKKRKQSTNLIALPIMICSQKFVQLAHDQNMVGESFKLVFPAGTKYIPNVLNQIDLFNQVKQ